MEISRLTDQHIAELHEMCQQEWWTKGRRINDIRLMIEHSDLIVAYRDPTSGKPIAFARVLTDYVYKALIFDVIVKPAYRGLGVGRTILSAVLEHPSLKYVRHIELYCVKEQVPFYRKMGFTMDTGGLNFMRKIQREERE